MGRSVRVIVDIKWAAEVKGSEVWVPVCSWFLLGFFGFFKDF